MIRVVVFLIAVALIAVGAAWLADRPGDVTVLWLGRRIETSVAVAIAGVAIVALLAIVLWSLVRLALHSPRLVGRVMVNRRRARAHRAISHGLVAVGAGDMRAAQKFAAEADRLAPREPLTLLLGAQVAQMAGDRAAAERAFHAMAHRSDTRLLGMRGLYIEAQRRDDAAAAHHYAVQAAEAAPALPWAGQAVLEDRSASGDWTGALAALDKMRQSGVVDRATYRRRRAVLLTARALAEADNESGNAKTLALEAVRLAPDLTPAAALAGRLLAENGELRKAARILETAWRTAPHPDLAEVYTHLRSGDSARDRLTRVQVLARQGGGIEAGLAVARAAIDAREFATARKALRPFTAAPTQRVALMMAEMEESEHGDIGRAREWMTRALHAARDPAWTADGIVSDHWLPVSPVTGEIDAFRWKAPLSEIAGPKLIDRGELDEVIEPPRPRRLPEPAALPDQAPPASFAPHEDEPGRHDQEHRDNALRDSGARTPEPSGAVNLAPGVTVAPGTTVAAAANVPANASVPPDTSTAQPQSRRDNEAGAAMPHGAAMPRGGTSGAPVVDAVIPLVHAPDDPGPPEEPAPAAPRRRSLFW
jgi:HemY protein